MTPSLRLLPSPGRAYAALAADLERLGWEWAGEAQTLPLLPGEPEWVEYRHPAGGTLRYDFNPAIGLRELAAEAPPAQLEGLAALPRLSPDDVRALLTSADVGELLLGLFAVRALGLVGLLGRVRELCHHADELVRRAADDVARTTRAAEPGRSILLGAMDVSDRRQVLRWLGHDRKDANEHVLAALRTGLDDDDDEVRITAALVAARLGAGALAGAVRALRVPAVFAGAHAQAVAALDAGRRLPSPPEPADEASLLVHALLAPLPVVPPAPELPRHLRRDGGVVRLARSGLEVALVPSLPHWLGGAGGAGPPRTVRARPFAIAARPHDEPLTLDDAREWVLALGRLERVAMRLPDADAWEMAMRGPDGRRFAAGNLAPEPAISPWGAVATDELEWLEGGLVGAAATPVSRRPALPGARHLVRFMLAFPI